MDKREQELRQKVADLKAKAEEFNNSGKYEEAKAKIEETKNAKNELDNYLAMMQIQVSNPVNSQAGVLPPSSVKNEDPSYKEVFMKAIRGQNLSHEEANVMQEYKASLSENTGKDGGYIVPEDITTTINQLKQTTDSLEQYVNVQPVSTNKGARTLEKRAASTPFAPLSEYGNPNEMKEISSPQFDRIPFAIDDYAGFLPVPNDLLNDTDQALEAYLRQWIAKKSIATRNYLILQEINKLTKVDLKDYNGLKTTLNVTLDPIFAAAANIVTNQDGFNYLDQLEDKNGRPLLQPDPTNPTRKLFAGKPVVVLSNKTIATDGEGKAPFIVGDLKEAIVLWDRQQLSIDMTKEGGNAWRSNTTEFRAIEREDVTLWDSEAVVYGEITVAPKTGA
ncbi:phage major capsid protein [Bacillus thuringiensis LM1212]|uniref:phage major capsid protein n=1 Tax=Bacillus cereus group TaxID=86661 RepID=UPI0003FEAC1B|nr:MULTISPECIES: phage major capsid protein [Bacillus cereus group]AXY06543.1 phage major capsid protein [Bacillus thuringiensis LM1212]QDF24936.1 phage major capsid protein [Bacillus tropicus]QUG98252.1 phage major capsid protein [Bacillus tropicus]